jgi:hypothetical protein
VPGSGTIGAAGQSGIGANRRAMPAHECAKIPAVFNDARRSLLAYLLQYWNYHTL